MENDQTPETAPHVDGTPLRQQSRTHHTFMTRLVGIRHTLNENIRRMQNNPEMIHGVATQLSTTFNRTNHVNDREITSAIVRERGGRLQGGRGLRSQELRIRLVCLRRPERSSSNISCQELQEYGLGNASCANERGICVIPIDWTEDDMRQYIQEAFPILESIEYEARRSERGGRLVRLDSLRPSELRTEFLAGRRRIRNAPTVFITPLEEINHRDMDTPTVLGRVPSTRRQVTSSTTSDVTDILDTTTPIPDNNLQTEPIEITRRIRHDQDIAYNESLRVDQERVRVQREIQDREARRRRLSEERSEEVRLLREERRNAIPEQPESGVLVRIRFPNGDATVRRFDPDMKIDALINTAGAHSQSTRDFTIRLPWSGRSIHSRDTDDVTLRVMGFTQSSAVDIAWINEIPSISPVSSPRRSRSRLLHSPSHPSDSSPSTPTYMTADEVEDCVSTPLVSSTRSSPLASSIPDVSAVADESSLNLHLSAEERVTNVFISRNNIFQDMTGVFHSDDILQSTVRVTVAGENAVDQDGVFRDVLTAFWTSTMDERFVGDEQAAPVVSAATTPSMWQAIGRILIQGYRQVGYLPLRFGLASLLYSMFGAVHEEDLIRCWLLSLAGFDRGLMRRMLDSGVDADDIPDVVDILDRFQVRTMPSTSNVRSLAVRCAEVQFIENAAFPLRQMGLERLCQDLPLPQAVRDAVEALRPDGCRVARLVQDCASTPVQQQMMQYLRQSIRSMDEDLLRRFLRFVSGSDVVNFELINVQFVALRGLQRRVVAHTCNLTLDVPTTYTSFNDFNRELRNVLMSDVWDMDFA